MKRIGILTAGGDTPALNATIHGMVTRANQLRIDAYGLIGGFGSLLQPRMPYVHLNPLFTIIPELDPTKGGTIIGASRDLLDPNDDAATDAACARLRRLQIDGLICVGGDGTLRGLQSLQSRIPVVLAPKTIDNDLGLNYPSEADQWRREPSDSPPGYRCRLARGRGEFQLDQMINYVTPGFATAVFVAADGVERIRTTAESHRRVAIVEAMGRQSGYIALGSAFGQPDIVLVPEVPLNRQDLVARVREVFDLQQNVVIVCGEGIVDEEGRELGAMKSTFDPAGNLMLSGAAEALRQILIDGLGDNYFRAYRRIETAREAIFTRKIGHTQRGGRPLAFDRFYAAQLGGKAVEMLVAGQNNCIATLQWNAKVGFFLDSFPANRFQDRWGDFHPRCMHPSLYDAQAMQPSPRGIEYLLPIFSAAIGPDDMEHIRQTLFDSGNLFRPYHSVNTDVLKRTCYLE